jgi:hypothetical protein
MKYAKKLIKAFKKSPFECLSLTLGKVEGTSEAMYINACIAQPSTLGDRLQPLNITCHSCATKEERNAFIPLVIEALGRAQSIEELADLLKPPAPVELDVLSFETGDAMAKQHVKLSTTTSIP